jgi:hypothetical protein
MRRRPSSDEQVGKRRQHVFVVEPASHDQRQAFPARLVDDGEDPELAPVMGARLDKVVGPYVSRIRLVMLMYVQFPLSLREVEDLLFVRGIDIRHGAVRLW